MIDSIIYSPVKRTLVEDEGLKPYVSNGGGGNISASH